MRKILCLAAVVALLSTLFPGCAGTEQAVKESPKTAIGAGVGAVGGAVIGNLVGGKRGAVIGALLGGLTGGIIGRYADEKEKDLAQAGRDHGYAPSEGTRLKIDSVRANPAILDPGETVNINLTYAVLTPTPDAQILVRETRRIELNGNKVGETAIEVSREGGTWKSTVPVTLPANAAPGNYRIVASVESAGAGQEVSETFFTVRR